MRRAATAFRAFRRQVLLHREHIHAYAQQARSVTRAAPSYFKFAVSPFDKILISRNELTVELRAIRPHFADRRLYGFMMRICDIGEMMRFRFIAFMIFVLVPIFPRHAALRQPTSSPAKNGFSLHAPRTAGFRKARTLSDWVCRVGMLLMQNISIAAVRDWPG